MENGSSARSDQISVQLLVLHSGQPDASRKSSEHGGDDPPQLLVHKKLLVRGILPLNSEVLILHPVPSSLIDLLSVYLSSPHFKAM